MLKAEGGTNSSASSKTFSETDTSPSSHAKEPDGRSSSDSKHQCKRDLVLPPRTSSIEAQRSEPEALQRNTTLSPATSFQQLASAKLSNESNRSDRPSLAKRPSDDSIRSNFSSTSSVFSTASKISRLPHAVKNSFVSVKDFVALKAHRSRSKTQSRFALAQQQQQQQEIATASSQYAQTIHYSTLGSTTYSDRETFASRLRRRTPSTMGLVSMFSSSQTANKKDDVVNPSSSTSSSILEVKDARGGGKTNRRSSVVNVATRLLRRDETNKSPLRSRVAAIDEDEAEANQLGFSDEFESAIQGTADQKAVGKLLFGVDIGSIDFFDQDFARSATSSTISTVSHLDTETSDAKSDHITSKPSTHQVVWGRQRAKSCQETKVPSLRQLAKGNYAASTGALSSNSPPPPPPMPVGKFMPEHDTIQVFPVARPEIVPKALDTFGTSMAIVAADSFDTTLVTATLTTLHSKLINDCDQTLASTILPASKSSNSLDFPEERLRNIAHDLRKMSNMVKWEDADGPLSKTAIATYFESLDQQIAQGKYMQSRKRGDDSSNQAVANVVKEIVSSLKHTINQCVCQYYKVTERAMIIPCKGFKVEGLNRSGATKEDYPSTSPPRDYSDWPVQHMDEEAYMYRKHFVGKDYVTFVGYVNDDEPLLISAIRDEGSYRLIIRGKQGPDIRKVIPDSFLLNTPSDADTQMESVSDSTWKAVVETSSDISLNQLKKVDKETILSLGLENEILRLDESAVHCRYKFGVVHVKEGQIREEEWFSNDEESEKFSRFLEIIGRRVDLLGYSGWAAGLDTKGGDSGEYTFVNEWKEHSIAYHVAPLIPSRRGDKQHIQRKRHIGNDIVCIVFAEGKQPFNPAAIKSQFLHVFIVVHEEEWEGRIGWRVEVAMADSLPAFGPPLPEKAFFYDEEELRSFMLAKLINAEYAAYKSPKFTQPMARAREGILSNLVERVSKHVQSSGLSQTKHNKSPSTSSERSIKSAGAVTGDDVVPTASRSSMIKEGIANLGRRRSGQSSDSNRSRQTKPRKSKASKAIEGGDQQSRSRSELDLLQPSSSTMTSSRSSGAVLQSTGKKEDRIRIRNRAHNILSSTLSNIGGGGSTRPK